MPNVYEADFKSFFDSISIKGLGEVLNFNLGMPEGEVKFINDINKSLVKLTKHDKIPEPERPIIFDRQGRLSINAHDCQAEFEDRIVNN
jgi:hypothetical protein